MSNESLEQRARELLAAEYDKDGLHLTARDLLENGAHRQSVAEYAIAAIIAALESTPAQEVELPGGVAFGDWAAWLRDRITTMLDPHVQGPYGNKLADWLDSLEHRSLSARTAPAEGEQVAISAGDAVFSFAALLTSLPHVVPFGAAAWATPGVDLATAFNVANGLTVSRDFPQGLKFPEIEGDLLDRIKQASTPATTAPVVGDNLAVAALREIADPIGAMKARLEPGERIDGAMAVHMSNSVDYVKSIARKALEGIDTARPAKAESTPSRADYLAKIEREAPFDEFSTAKAEGDGAAQQAVANSGMTDGECISTLQSYLDVMKSNNPASWPRGINAAVAHAINRLRIEPRRSFIAPEQRAPYRSEKGRVGYTNPAGIIINAEVEKEKLLLALHALVHNWREAAALANEHETDVGMGFEQCADELENTYHTARTVSRGDA